MRDRDRNIKKNIKLNITKYEYFPRWNKKKVKSNKWKICKNESAVIWNWKFSLNIHQIYVQI